MNHVLSNGELTVTIREHGAEPVSARRGACEYLWQGDPAFWSGRAPLLFPICGRLFGGTYRHEGRRFEMGIHGFARHCDFAAERLSETALRLTLRPSPETRRAYPFDFALTVEYRLDGAMLACEARVDNPGPGPLPFAFGAHPGFNVPLAGAGAFEDWELAFDEPCSPDRFLLSDACFQTGRKAPFALEGGRTLRLRHDLFDRDAIFLSRTSGAVTLRSARTERFVRVRYPDMPYVGFWHPPRTEAPFVCIEPWCGLPSFEGVEDDFAAKTDFFRLPPGTGRRLLHEITFG